MKKTLPKAKPQLRHVFTDIDGTRYFIDRSGDIVNKHGELVTLTEEYNVRAFLERKTSELQS